MTQPNCSICGEPMPEGEEMFKFHGYSGPCPKGAPLKPVEPTPEPPRGEAHYAKVREDEAGFVRYDAVSRAGEDRVHLYGWRLNGTQVGLGYIRRRADNTIELTEERAQSVEPAPPTPAPCVWRICSGSTYADALAHMPMFAEDCQVAEWKFCPVCGHPLEITR